MDVAHALECEGAVVHHARDIEPALRIADHPSLSAGIIDVHLVSGSAESVCERLTERSVPFIFYTGTQPLASARFAGAPIVQKPSPAPRILGALRYALSAEPRDVLAPLAADRDLLRAIRNGEERIERIRALIPRLEALGSDTSAAQRLLASIHTALETMRYSANIGSSPPWSANCFSIGVPSACATLTRAHTRAPFFFTKDQHRRSFSRYCRNLRSWEIHHLSAMYIGASTRPARTTPKARLARTPVTNHGSCMELGIAALRSFALAGISDRLRLMQFLDELPKSCG
jgi:hypothetical protein